MTFLFPLCTILVFFPTLLKNSTSNFLSKDMMAWNANQVRIKCLLCSFFFPGPHLFFCVAFFFLSGFPVCFFFKKRPPSTELHLAGVLGFYHTMKLASALLSEHSRHGFCSNPELFNSFRTFKTNCLHVMGLLGYFSLCRLTILVTV